MTAGSAGPRTGVVNGSSASFQDRDDGLRNTRLYDGILLVSADG